MATLKLLRHGLLYYDADSKRYGVLRRMTHGQHTRSVLLRINTATLALYILVFCIAAEVAFVVLDYYINYRELVDIGAMRRMFNIAREDSLASWFGTTQTLLAGLTLWLIHAVARHHGAPGAGSSSRCFSSTWRWTTARNCTSGSAAHSKL